MSQSFLNWKRKSALLTLALFLVSNIQVAAAQVLPTDNSQQVAFISNVNVTKATFSPSAGEQASLNYYIDDFAASVKLQAIKNDTNTIAEEVVQLAVPRGTHTFNWDGKVEGQPVANGTYRIVLKTTNRHGVNTYYGGANEYLTVQSSTSTQTPLFSTFNVDRTTFNPTQNSVLFTFGVTQNAYVRAQIRNSNGNTVRTFYSTNNPLDAYSNNSYSVSWNDQLTAGNYQYYFEVVNKNNNQVTDTRSGTLTLQYSTTENTSPVLTDVKATPTSFNPSNNETTTFSYRLDRSVNSAKVTIFTGYEEIVLTGTTNQNNNTVVWNGRNSNGQIVAPGSYTFQVTATNNAGTAYAFGQTPVTIVNQNQTYCTPVLTITNSNQTTNPNQSVTFNYNVDKASKITARIYNGNTSGNVVRTIYSSSSPNYVSAGTYSITWDGRNDAGTMVGTGTYILEMVATGTAQSNCGSDTETASIYVTNNNNGSRPSITYAEVSPTTFNPNTQNDATIRYNIDKTANVTVQILDNNYNVLRTLKDNESQSSGEHYVTWNGEYASGGNFPEGTYRARIQASNSYGSDTRTISFFVDYDNNNSGDTPTVTSTSVSPNPFDPEEESTRIEYYLDRSAEVTVEILDQLYGNNSGNVIRTLLDDVNQSSGEQYIMWNGRNSSGSYVSDGEYFVRIKAMNNAGSYTKILNVYVDRDQNNGQDLIRNVDVDPNPFDPEEEYTRVEYTLDRSAYVTVEVLDELYSNYSGDVIRTLLDNSYLSSGSHSVTWNGRDRNGNYVSDGEYFIRIRGTVNNQTYTRIVNVDVDRDGYNNDDDDLIRNLEVSPDTFDPTEGQNTVIRYRLSHSASVTIQILNNMGVVVRTLAEDSSRSTSNYNSYYFNEIWNGRNGAGEYVQDGLYQVKITARGNGRTQTAYEDVEVDRYGSSYGSCAGFTDVSANHADCDAIEYVKSIGAMTGHPDGRFDPYGSLQRDQVTKIILEAFDLYNSGTDYCQGYRPFPDVTMYDWSYQYVCRGKQINMIVGYLAGEFAGRFMPGNPVSRIEFLALLTKNLGVSSGNVSTGYADLPSTHWGAAFARYANDYDLFEGSYLHPNQATTRLEVARVLYRLHNLGKLN